MMRAMTVGLLCFALGCSASADDKPKPIAALKGIGKKHSESFRAPDNWVLRWKFEEKCYYFRIVDAKTDERLAMVANTTGATSSGLAPTGKKFFEKGGEFKIVPVTSGPWRFTVEKFELEE